MIHLGALEWHLRFICILHWGTVAVVAVDLDVDVDKRAQRSAIPK
jgi:hypothetical protein